MLIEILKLFINGKVIVFNKNTEQEIEIFIQDNIVFANYKYNNEWTQKQLSDKELLNVLLNNV